MADYDNVHAWDLPGCPFQIEFARSVIDQINEEVTQAFYSIPKGGAETGGVLYGTRAASRLSILIAEPLECEHSFGPSFTLSERDHARLATCLERPKSDTRLGEMAVVGWYHSHTRSEISLTDADLAIHREFFGEPWQIAVVLRPSLLEPTRLGVFFRRADGSLVPNGAQPALVVGRQERMRAAAAAAGAAAAPTLGRHDVNEMIGTEQPMANRRRLPLGPGKGRRRSRRRSGLRRGAAARPAPASSRTWRKRLFWASLAVAVCLAAVGVYVGTHFGGGRQDGQSTALRVRASDQDGQLHIAWDRQAAADVVSGILQIRDGEAVKAFVLDRELIDTGSINYDRRSDVVGVSLTLVRNDGAKLRGSTSYAANERQAFRSSVPVPLPPQPERRAPSNVAPTVVKPKLSAVRPSGTRDAAAAKRRIFRPPTERRSKYLLPPPPDLESSHVPMNRGLPLPVAAVSALPATPAPALKHPSIAGRWTSRGVRTSRRSSIRSGLGRPLAVARELPGPLPSGPVYEPESVEVFLSDNGREVVGSLTGRYRTPKSSGLDPNVSFTFGGSRATSLRFPLRTSDGRQGEVEFIPLPGTPDRIRIVWSASGRRAVFDHIVRRIYSY